MPQLLDIIRIGLQEACPAPYQPENWFVDSTRWRLIQRPGPVDLMERFVEHAPLALGSPGDRIPMHFFESSPATASLTVVRPDRDEVKWSLGLDENFRARFRAIFRLGGQSYDLSVTDPVWRDRMFKAGEGVQDNPKLGIASGAAVYLVCSLGEPFNGYCYKLVAGVIVIAD